MTGQYVRLAAQQSRILAVAWLQMLARAVRHANNPNTTSGWYGGMARRIRLESHLAVRELNARALVYLCDMAAGLMF